MIIQLIITILWVAYGILCYIQDSEKHNLYLILYILLSPIVFIKRALFGVFSDRIFRN